METNLKVTDVKVFVPARNFQLSRAFYEALGWTTNWVHEEGLAEMELGGTRFLLQNYYRKAWANNFMFYINVEDVEAWYRQISEVLAQNDFGKARVEAPQKQPHQDTVCFVWDPSGVLLHFAQAER